jgi:hypothetical protein
MVNLAVARGVGSTWTRVVDPVASRQLRGWIVQAVLEATA